VNGINNEHVQFSEASRTGFFSTTLWRCLAVLGVDRDPLTLRDVRGLRLAIA